MNRVAYKTLSSELRKSLFKGEFHTYGSVFIIKQRNGIEATRLDNRRLSLPIDRAWMTKSSRRELLRLARKTPTINLPN